MKKIVIIHLSDIHFNDSDENDTLLNNLISDIELMKKDVKKYDLLAISGDCIDRGQVDLFDSFNKKLSIILKTAELTTKNRMIVVPGNHDVSRENIWLKSLNVKEDNIINVNQQIEKDMSPLFKEYNDFVKKYGAPNNGIGVKYFNCNGAILRVIHINSAWSTLSYNKYGELIIGERQISELKKKLEGRKQKYDLTIACMHHPLDWFKYEERIKLQEFLYNTAQIDFLLHGHIHEASYDVVMNMDSARSIFCTEIGRAHV